MHAASTAAFPPPQGYRQHNILPTISQDSGQYADYPGITPDADHEVCGMYVTGITSANMQKLDQFEGSE